MSRKPAFIFLKDESKVRHTGEFRYPRSVKVESKFVISKADIHASKSVHARHAGVGRYPLLAKACISISLYQAGMDSGLRQNDGIVLAVA